jgi:hypothetical protein
MPISRMQQPRQQYGLGSLVKSITKGVKKIVKSPLGKAAILGGLGMIPFGATGTSLFGRMGAGLFGTGLPLGSPKMGGGVSKGLLGKIGLSGSAGKAALGIGAASTLAGILASDADMTEEEAEQLKQDPVALKNYLTLYYSNLNPRASKEEVDSFVRTNMYADGGRVNYQQGSQPAPAPAPAPAQLGSSKGASPLYQNVLQYLQRSGKQNNSVTPAAWSTKNARGFQGLEPGGVDDPRSIALNNLRQLGYDTSRFIEVDDPSPSMLTSMLSGLAPNPSGLQTGSMPNITFKDEDTLTKLMNPAFDFQQGTYINLLEKAKDIGRDYTIDEALELNKETLMEIADLYDKKNKYGKYKPVKSAALTTYTGPTNFTYGGGQTGVATPFNQGGRVGYKFGDVVDQASGIMGLPKRVNKAGVNELDLRESGGFIPPVGVKEKADDIPAMLSNNEFVFTADAVRGMGDGNVNKGAQRMYDMMKKLEKGGRV